MTLDRRTFLRLAGLSVAGSIAASCTPLYRELAGDPLEHWEVVDLPDSTFRALSRMTYGPRISERLFVQQHGIGAWIEEQLSPSQIDDSGVQWRLRTLESIDLPAHDIENWEKDDVISELSQGAILRATYSNRQLYEVMVRFWSDHFNVSVDKGDCWLYKPTEERDVIRPHALGQFEDLLLASAHSPAMLVYLDNQANKWEAPNENYAREVMELHTLGVEGGYTQQDVMELARMLTGWSVKDHFWKGQFTFEEDWHDPGTKVFLGHRIRSTGIREGEEVLAGLAVHHASAEFISTKLMRRFLCDDPMEEYPELHEQAVRTFIQSRGDIREVMRVILLDGLTDSSMTRTSKYKRPFEYVVSALRLLGVDTDGGASVQEALRGMGQPLYRWPTPDGPSDQMSVWLSNLLPRWNFALDLVAGNLEGTQFDLYAFMDSLGSDELVDQAERVTNVLVGGGANLEEIVEALLANASSLQPGSRDDFPILVAAILMSPAFQWRG